VISLNIKQFHLEIDEDEQKSTSIPQFNSILNTLSESLIMDKENEYLLDIVLATCLSVELDRPLFMMIQGVSSSGKSEFLKLPEQIVEYKKIHILTSNTLFSGHSEAKGGYLKSEVGDKGIICIPDFTTILSKKSHDRASIFSQLRIAYDGEGGSGTGVDVSSIEKNRWVGKIACLCAVTNKIEQIKDNASDLGERFLYYRHVNKPVTLEEEMEWMKSKKPLDFPYLQAEFLELFDKSKIAMQNYKVTDKKLSKLHIQYIYKAANFIAKLRTVVERNSYTREITAVNKPEKPYRLINQLENLFICLIAVHGESSKRVLNVMKSIVISSIPEIRLNILDSLGSTWKKTSDIASSMSLPDSTIKRNLEDLNALRLIDCQTGSIMEWKVSKQTLKEYDEVS